MKTPRIPIAIQQAVMRSLRENLAKANLKLERRYPEPTLVYQQRGTSAGTAWLEKNEIRLNPVLLLENQQAFIDEVVPHELAHLLVWKHFGRVAPHGKEWKWMMESVLGVPARRTHRLNSIRSARTPSPTAVAVSSISSPSVAITAWFAARPPTAAFAAAICWWLKNNHRN
jgi:SprT protein